MELFLRRNFAWTARDASEMATSGQPRLGTLIVN
jgi:hypothetical protein